MNDYEIIDLLERKIITTHGAEQEEWVKKYDIFTSRNYFKEHDLLNELTEVEKIRSEFNE
ncbi:hypothetical protein FDC52_18350 [Clostridium botulinum]|uniref:hypothetical protein n=1 Tax=Clostridium sp. ZS6 TaxID=2949987 RepID=UPI001D6C1613|nr:hypothetical protein [Clostridium sp. ZS6]NFO89537.1 hypothetical protein [Clostridium botulinum]